MAERIIPEAKSRSRLLSFINEYKDKTGTAPGSPTGSVQINVSGSFSGSDDLVWVSGDHDGLGIGAGAANPPKVHLDVNHSNVAWLDADTGGGESVTFGTGLTTKGKLYYLHTGSSEWKQTDADVQESGSYQMLAIALGAKANVHGMLIRGFYHMDSYLEGSFVAGRQVWMGDATGYASVDKPTASKAIVRQVGYCIPTSKIVYFNPSTYFVQLP